MSPRMPLGENALSSKLMTSLRISGFAQSVTLRVWKLDVIPARIYSPIHDTMHTHTAEYPREERCGVLVTKAGLAVSSCPAQAQPREFLRSAIQGLSS